MSMHGGNLKAAADQAGIPQKQLLDFSANINPLGFPDWLRPLISASVESLLHYPDPDCGELIAAMSQNLSVPAERLIVGNGASELLATLPKVLGCDSLLLPVPSYVEYRLSAEQSGMPVEPFLLTADHGFRLEPHKLQQALRPGQMVIIGQPNNPTGTLCSREDLLDVIRSCPDNVFVIDESFIDFCDVESYSFRHQQLDNLIIVQSLTKAWGIPGLRLGLAIAPPAVAKSLKKSLPVWSVNTLAQVVGTRAFNDSEFLPETRRYVDQQRELLFKRLAGLPGVTPLPGAANFLLVHVDGQKISATELIAAMLKRGIMLRRCDNFDGLDASYVRIAVRTEKENQRLCEELQALLTPAAKSARVLKTPALMFQGTGSNAGKSILTAAMCRILQQDGVSVAPFKAQNMSLNSCVTFQGGEMGRAQVLQAQAARLDPDVRMNPVLLKPSSRTGSQVIVCGKVLETMDFKDYAARRAGIFRDVQDCYNSLAAEHQVMVLEGAGSPAEINLKSRDIVNMNMARYADARVMLVGDIDRGGVFASFVGTMELLNEWERGLVEGFVINRFRGDATLLGDALERTSLHSGKPFLGVVPYLPHLGLPEEDSVDFKDGLLETSRPEGEVLDIALVDLPHISNFTDFDALREAEDAHVRKVNRVADLGTPDVVILPGSKNVIHDLNWLNESGFAAAVQGLAASGTTEIVGICGGYQLLGRKISDPHGIESTGLECQGLGLLDMDTILAPQKTTTSCQARHLVSGQELRGYEIHHGLSNGNDVEPLVERYDGVALGCSARERDWIWGTYLHGVFDADGFRNWFLDRVRVRKGWEPLAASRAVYDLEPALDRLAAHVREHMDMDRIYRILNL